MPKTTLHLPVIQNWSCHNCGGCCREHLIEVTADEKQRIERQRWSSADGVPSDRPLIVRHGNDAWRLNHQQDGACVFLDDKGLCRIHGKFGEAAKPLACRVYPYAVHPVSSSLTVSLRFSCPSVVQNLGQPVHEQKWLNQLSEEIVSGKRTQLAPPALYGGQQLDWEDLLKFVAVIDASLVHSSTDDVTFAVRLMRVLSWLELVEESRFDTVRGKRLDDYLDLVTRAARKAQPDNDLPVLKPSRMGRLIFRLIVAQLLRHDTAQTVSAGLRARAGLFRTGVKFTLGKGTVPQLPEPPSVVTAFRDGKAPNQQRISFADLERPFEGRTPEIDELMTRYFRVKIQGMHFCGVANFNMSLVDGFRSLALMYPAVLWVARMKSAAAGRETLAIPDVQSALATLDHNFAYSPALGTKSGTDRIRILGRMQQVTRLCGWYSL
jgi:lysine-N-methylase